MLWAGLWEAHMGLVWTSRLALPSTLQANSTNTVKASALTSIFRGTEPAFQPDSEREGVADQGVLPGGPRILSLKGSLGGMEGEGGLRARGGQRHLWEGGRRGHTYRQGGVGTRELNQPAEGIKFLCGEL